MSVNSVYDCHSTPSIVGTTTGIKDPFRFISQSSFDPESILSRHSGESRNPLSHQRTG
jgi:hypothetical protein